jgi:predicted MFS family arabinose efflux permease
VSVPVFVRTSLSGNASLIGLAFTAGMAGSLLGTLAAATRGRPGPHAVPRSAAAMAAGLAITAVAPGAAIALAGLAAVGFGWSTLLMAVTATLQGADASMTGRVMATMSVVLLGGMAAGAPLTSALISATGPRTTLALAALAALITAGCCAARRVSGVSQY